MLGFAAWHQKTQWRRGERNGRGNNKLWFFFFHVSFIWDIGCMFQGVCNKKKCPQRTDLFAFHKIFVLYLYRNRAVLSAAAPEITVCIREKHAKAQNSSGRECEGHITTVVLGSGWGPSKSQLHNWESNELSLTHNNIRAWCRKSCIKQ